MRTAVAAVILLALLGAPASAAQSPTPKPTTAAQKKAAAAEAARQAAQRAAGEFVTIATAKRPVFPKWKGKTIDGAAWSTSSMRGNVTVVNFWASWCGPCKDEWGDLEAAAKANPKITFIGINSMDRLTDATAFLEEQRATYVHVFDERGVVMASYRGVPKSIMPTTLILDASGRIAAWRAGPVKQTQLQRGINAVLKSSS